MVIMITEKPASLFIRILIMDIPAYPTHTTSEKYTPFFGGSWFSSTLMDPILELIVDLIDHQPANYKSKVLAAETLKLPKKILMVPVTLVFFGRWWPLYPKRHWKVKGKKLTKLIWKIFTIAFSEHLFCDLLWVSVHLSLLALPNIKYSLRFTSIAE